MMLGAGFHARGGRRHGGVARGFRLFVAGLFGLLGGFLLGACEWRPKAGPTALARVGDREITSADLDQSLGPRTAGRERLPAHSQQSLQSLIRFRVLVEEARQRVYDKDPQLVRAFEQQMVARLVSEEADRPLREALTADEVARYYEAHRQEFEKPEQVRVSEVVLRDDRMPPPIGRVPPKLGSSAV